MENLFNDAIVGAITNSPVALVLWWAVNQFLQQHKVDMAELREDNARVAMKVENTNAGLTSLELRLTRHHCINGRKNDVHDSGQTA